ncbi:MAG: hypothetical protein CVU84_11775 [Firmicutes bacterium HGW-Firmicutes-1]|jgi:glycosyltransferase involved in cell wall biosynthesis|nr:MAG: hypothetical protein CVU84_11775 [Firmicutes bacterium HGW-Firmicutes-1]
MSAISKFEYEQRLSRLIDAYEQKLLKTNRQIVTLHIVYVVGNPSICGATKIIYEQANRLVEKGVVVTIVSYGERPKWFQLKANYIKVPSKLRISLLIPKCHIVVATYYTHIQECIEAEIAPVVYFEQGDTHLFEYEKLEDEHKAFVRKQFELPRFIMTVSNKTSKLISRYFKREAVIIPNAIDTHIFNHKKLEDGLTYQEEYLLMMGRDDVAFKGIEEIIIVFKRLKEFNRDIKLYWITPYPPNNQLEDMVTKVIINPTQDEISALLKGAILYISASYLESFSLPVLEAMASGCPVLSADNEGVKEYGVDGYNLLLYEKGNMTEMTLKILKIYFDGELRDVLIKNGFLTAQKYSWSDSIEKLYQFFRCVAHYEVCGSRQLKNTNLKRGFNNMIEVFEYANELYQNNVYEEAIYFLNEFINYDISNEGKKIEAYRMRYLAYYLMGDIKTSRYYCFLVFELGIPQAKECCFLGETFLNEGRVDEASFWFEKAII